MSKTSSAPVPEVACDDAQITAAQEAGAKGVFLADEASAVTEGGLPGGRGGVVKSETLLDNRLSWIKVAEKIKPANPTLPWRD